MINTYNKFQENMMRIYYILKRKQVKIFPILIIISILLGFFGYQKAYQINWLEAVYRSFTQFAFQTDWDLLQKHMHESKSSNKDFYNVNIPQLNIDLDIDLAYWMVLSSASIAYIAMFLGTILLFLEKTFIYWRTLYIKKHGNDYHIVIGLGDNSKPYLRKSLKNNKSTVIVDKDRNLNLLREFLVLGAGVLQGDATDEEFLKSLELNRAKQIFISAGEDETNIEIALEIITLLNDQKKQDDKNTAIIISLTPKGVQHYYTNQGLLDIHHNKIRGTDYQNIDLRVFCYAEEAARDLFKQYDIDGENNEIIDTTNNFAMIIIGSGDLALQIIYHATIMSTLPNENHFTIYCIDDNNSNLQKNLNYLYGGIHDIQNLSIEFLPEYRITSVQRADIFVNQYIKNIIVCDDDQTKNIQIAADLAERVYRHQQGSPKILTAIYDKEKISNRIHNISIKDALLKDVFTFASTSIICSPDIVLGEHRYDIAKFMAQGYEDIFDDKALVEENSDKFICMNKKWNSLTISDKASNLSQAEHIKTKLKALKLEPLRGEGVTLEENRKIFDEALSKFVDVKELFIDIQRFSELTNILKNDQKKEDDEYQKLIAKYFPKNKKSFIERMINCEHERWNRHHYLNNWKFSPNKSKELKLHNSLKPFSDFEDDMKGTILYDLYAFLYLPNYCTQVGWRLTPISTQKVIGVTGHRNIIENENLIKKIDEQLINMKKGDIELKTCQYIILSPLADGADMLVAERAMKVLNAELKVILPFELEIYKNGKYDYKGINAKERFEQLYRKIKSENISELNWINDPICQNFDINDQFSLVGKTIVNESDILLALYDGEPAKGKGGTAEIVEYAKNENKKIITIDVERKKH